jgi:membrane protein
MMWARAKELPREAWKAALTGFGHGITNFAGALTFFSLLSLFPGLIILVALLATIGQTSASELVVTLVEQLAPPDAVAPIRGPLTDILAGTAGATSIVSLSVVLALWAASGYVGCFIWAVERIYPVQKAPTFLQGLVRQLLFAVIILLLLAVMAVRVVVGGRSHGSSPRPWASATRPSSPTGSSAGRCCSWRPRCCSTPCTSPPRRAAAGLPQSAARRGPGVTVWAIASAIFNLYTTHLGRYGATYGTLAASSVSCCGSGS